MKFWAVWRETGGAAPSKRHDTKESAIAEAGRLARTTGERYFVLEVVGVSAPTTPPVEYTDIYRRNEMSYKVGDRIRMTTLTWGELITDRKGKAIHQTPYKCVYEGAVSFAGPEGAFKGAVEVVRCNGGNKALKLNSGFSFYPKDNGPEQLVEVLSAV